ncbi:MAG: hypothetical protein U0936_10700 [Planctomycetaceae bacterium]
MSATTVTASGGIDVPLCSVANRHREILMRQATRLGMHSVMAAFQILSDAKNQMFRSTFARTVLEMAMVQLSLLENLTAISDLLSGRLPALPELPALSTSAHAASSSVASPQSSPASVVEKKNNEPLNRSSSLIMPPDVSEHGDEESDELHSGESDDDLHDIQVTSPNAAASSPPAAAVVSESTRTTPPVVANVEQAQQATVSVVDGSAPMEAEKSRIPTPPSAPEPASSLTQADCPRLFQELLKTVGLTISAGLKMASDLVLVAPNRLEIHLDGSYDFAKKVLDQPDSRSRIEAEILKLVGEPFSVNLRLLASTRPKPQPAAESTTVAKNGNATKGSGQAAESAHKPPAKAVEAAPPQRNLLGEVDPSRDPFVRQVMEVFGATVVKVTAAPAVKVAEAESLVES